MLDAKMRPVAPNPGEIITVAERPGTAPPSGPETRPDPVGHPAPLPRLRLPNLLLGLVLAVLLPALALGVAATWYAVAGERAAAEGRLRDTAQALALALDQKIAVNFAALDGLVTSPAFNNDPAAPDLPTLYAQARRVAEKLDVTIFMAARDGTQLLSTSRPFGTPLPRIASIDAVNRVVITDRPVVGDLVVGSVSGRLAFPAMVPIVRPGDGVVLAVSASFGVEKVQNLLQEASMPEGAVAAVSDAKGIFVALSDPRQTARVGHPITQISAKAFAENSQGFYRNTSDDGVQRVVAFHKLNLAAGWTLTVAQPAATFDAAWRTPLLALSGGSALALALGAWFAALAGRQILTPLRQLGVYARIIAMPGGATIGGTIAGTQAPAKVAELEELRRGFSAAEDALRRHAKELGALFQVSPIGIARSNFDGRVLDANDAMLRILGATRAELAAGFVRWDDRTPPEYHDVTERALAEAMAAPDGRCRPYEKEFVRKDGIRVPVLIAFSVQDRTPGETAGFVMDLTDIRSQEALLRLFVDRTPAGIAMFDTEMRYLAVSQRFIADYGLQDETPQSLLGRSHYELFPDLPEHWLAIHRRVLAGETLSAHEDAFPRDDGHTDWVNWEMKPWHQPDGSLGGAMLFSEVITDRKNKELALTQSEARLRGLLDTLPANIALLDSAGRVITVNEAWRVFGAAEGLSPDYADLVGTNYLTFCAPAAAAGDATALAVMDGLRDIFAGRRERVELVYPCHAPDGPERWFQFIAVPVIPKPGADEPMGGAVVMHLDITQRVLAEQALTQSEARLRGLLDTVVEGIILATEDGHIVSANPAVTRIFGYADEQQLVGKPLTILMPKSEASHHDSYLGHHRTTGASRVITVPGRQLLGVRQDGSEFPLELSISSFHSGNTRYLTGVLRDISERQRSEAVERHAERLEQLVKVRTRELEETQAQLVQAAKMEALGRLAGGVAHDFNNVLQAALGGVALAGKRLRTDPAAAEHVLEMTSAAVERGAAVTRRLLAFARRSPLSAAPIVPLALLEGMLQLLRPTLGPAVTLEMGVGPDVPALFADSGQLESVLVNLANNARDALVKGVGTIRLTAVAAAAPGDAPAELAPGDYVRLSVVDDGTGMPPDVLARASEAFFTTKPKGQGTGLGVAMARGFAEQSGGAFAIESTPGQGTTVSLWLPAAPAEAVDAHETKETAVEVPTPRRPGMAILLVDDEPGLRTVLAALLTDEGDRISQAGDGASALALLDAGLVVDVLVTDFTMPGGMDGLELIQEARRRRPGLPAVLVTGHPADAAGINIEQLAELGRFAVLGKPFLAKILTARLVRLLRD